MPQSKYRTLAFYDGPAPASSPNGNRVVTADDRLFSLLLLVLRKLRSGCISFGLYEGEAPPPDDGSRLLVASKDTDLIGPLLRRSAASAARCRGGYAVGQRGHHQ